MKRKLLSLLLATAIILPIATAVILSASAETSAKNPENSSEASISLISDEAADVSGGQSGGGQSADARLAQVTAKVKQVLQLDTDAYDNFYGNLEEGVLAPTWHLEWSGDNGNVSVEASEDGKILQYYYNEPASDEAERRNNIPSFPAGDYDTAQKNAEVFLKSVLTDGESYAFTGKRTYQLNANTYRFYGNVLINGLPAGLSFSVSVRCGNGKVASFWRDDLAGRITGDIPGNQAQTSQDSAKSALRETLKLRLEYVREKSDSKKAVLRYLPEAIDSYYVDAATGETVNLTELQRKVMEDGGVRGALTANSSAAMKEEAAMDMDAEMSGGGVPAPALTSAEQAGAAKLEGVLSKEELEQKARAIAALGLDKYTLSSVNYRVPQQTRTIPADSSVNYSSSVLEQMENEVSAVLYFGRQVNSNSWRRTVHLNAKTGDLLRVYSSAWMSDETGKEITRNIKADAAQATAEEFLKTFCAGQFDRTELTNTSDALANQYEISHSFIFTQRVNGYLFADNTLLVGVDSTDGSISEYYNAFDEKVSFESADGLVSMSQAIDAWLNTYETKLQYIQSPVAIDYSRPEYEPLRAAGVQYLSKLVLGYALYREDTLAGINAKTCTPVKPDWVSSEDGLTYNDITGHWAKNQIETLGKYNVGYTDGRFQPDKSLTQKDFVILLASASRYRYDDSDEATLNRIYEYAYSQGILTPAERNENAEISRITAVQMLLDAAGYKSIARLGDIFKTKFADESDIPTGLVGYAALAQGLNLISGDGDGKCNPGQTATRAQAAVMLYNLMAR